MPACNRSFLRLVVVACLGGGAGAAEQPAAPPSACISTTRGTSPHRFGLPVAAYSSHDSAMLEEGGIG